MKLKPLCVLIAALALLALTPAHAESLKVEKVFDVLTGTLFSPKALLPMPDHALLLIADNANREGVALKLDQDGQTQWSYPVKQSSPNAYRGTTLAAAALGRDGKILLCANENDKEQTTTERKARFVMLDDGGKPIGEALLRTSDRPEFHFYELLNCGHWNDGFYALGIGVTVKPSEKRPGTNDITRHAWLIHLDGNGRPLWERLIDVHASQNSVSAPMVLPDGSLLLASGGRNDRAEVSDLVAVLPNGAVRQHKVIPVEQRFAQAQEKGALFLAFGQNGKMVWLDRDLEVTSESEAPPGMAWSKFAFRGAEGRLTSFALSRHPNGRLVRTAFRSNVDGTDSQQWLIPTHFNQRDGILAAAPLGYAGGYAIAFRSHANTEAHDGAKVGVGIAILRFQPAALAVAPSGTGMDHERIKP